MRAALVLGASGHQPAVLLHPAGEPVARALELFEVEQARAGDGLRRRGPGAGMSGKPSATIAESSCSSLATCARSDLLAARSPAIAVDQQLLGLGQTHHLLLAPEEPSLPARWPSRQPP